MKLLEGFRKLLGQAGEAVGAAATPPGMRGVGNMLRKQMPQQIQPIQREPMQARPMMNRMGENLSQEQLGQRMRMQNGQNAQQFVGRIPAGVNPMDPMNSGDESRGEIYPQYEMPRPTRPVYEDDAFGYTQDGMMPLSSAGPEKSWRPMYQLPNQEEHFNPFMRLMRRR